MGKTVEINCVKCVSERWVVCTAHSWRNTSPLWFRRLRRLHREDDISADLEEMHGSLPGTEKSKWHPGRLITYKSMFMGKRVAHMESVVICPGQSQQEAEGGRQTRLTERSKLERKVTRQTSHI